jgi:hypothetical protein
MSRYGGWIVTYSGIKMYPLDPRPEEICFEDIAHALSNLCRWTGHCKEFYSVAQHSVLVSVHCSPENAMWGLLHDASEAYLNDIARPLKISGDYSEYRKVESVLMIAIAEKFNLIYPIPDEVKDIDNRFIQTEARDLGLLCEGFPSYGEPFKTKITPVPPINAKMSFIDWYDILTDKK